MAQTIVWHEPLRFSERFYVCRRSVSGRDDHTGGRTWTWYFDYLGTDRLLDVNALAARKSNVFVCLFLGGEELEFLANSSAD